MDTETLEIRPCTTLEDYECCVEVQRRAWGFADIELVPKDVIVVAASIGGEVFGAFDRAEMLGFVLAFPGYREGRPFMHSHMLAVVPEYRDRGIGRRLKLRQREDTLARGLELVEWTFDPLELKNAYFNIERLGAIVRRYVRDKYGRTTSPLHGGLPTDRLLAEWWLRSPRVETVLRGQKLSPATHARRVRVPAAIAELKQNDRAAAEQVQSRVREQFERWFTEGYAVTGFAADEEGGNYLLEPVGEEK